MRRTHAFLIAVAIAVAVVFGSFAALRSTQLGGAASTPGVDTAQIARQNAALDRAQAALRAELAKRPPAVSMPGRPAKATPPQTVVYRRAPAVVKVIHHGDDGEHDRHDHESGEELDD